MLTQILFDAVLNVIFVREKKVTTKSFIIKMAKKKSTKRVFSAADQIYFSVFGQYASKNGTALEVLSTASYEIATRSQDSKLDLHINGLSGAPQQIDGWLFVNDEEVALESKDYSGKIGIGKIRDFEGAITDFLADRGVFAAEKFTKGARIYAKGTESNPLHKKITLLDVRGAKKEDLRDRICGFTIQTHVPPLPDSDTLKWYFCLTKQAEENATSSGIDIQNECGIRIVDSERNDVQIEPMLINNAIQGIKTNKCQNGDIFQSAIPVQGLYAMFHDGNLYEIGYFGYAVEVFSIDETTHIEPNGKPVFYIKCEEERINKLITDTDLIEWGRKHDIVKK